MVDLREICRLSILIVLSAAIVGKLRDLRPFLETIKSLTKMTRLRSRFLGLLVIGAEALAALLLASGGEWVRPGLGLSAGLFVAFAIVILRLEGRSVACNCFGGSGKTLTSADLARAALCLGFCVGGILLSSPEPSTFADQILRLGVASILAAALIGLPEFVALSQGTRPMGVVARRRV